MRLKFHWSLLLLASLTGLQHRATWALEGKHACGSDLCYCSVWAHFVASCRSVGSCHPELTWQVSHSSPPALFWSLSSRMFVQRKKPWLGQCVKFGTFSRCCGVPQAKKARGLRVKMVALVTVWLSVPWGSSSVSLSGVLAVRTLTCHWSWSMSTRPPMRTVLLLYLVSCLQLR